MLLFLRLIVLAGLVAMVYSKEKPCCVSKKYFGKIKSLTATVKNGSSEPIITENRFEIDYDFDMRMDKEMGTMYTDDGMMDTYINYTVINDYKHMKSYTMYMGSCTVEMVEHDKQTPHCVPRTLHWAASYTFGSGAHALPVNSWEGMFENFHYSMQTSVNDCTPISLTRFGMTPKGDRVAESILYVDITQYKVSSDDAFKIPAMCMMTSSALGKK